MRKPEVLRKFSQRLVQAGFAHRDVERRVNELADHWEDLQRAGLAEGLSDAEADDRAAARLGDPVALAKEMTRAARQVHWYGRHRWLAFCLLPPCLQLLFTAVIFGLSILIGELLVSHERQLAVARSPSGPLLVQLGMSLLFYAAAGATALWCCWWARRSVAGPAWALAACGICALHSYFWQVKVIGHHIYMGYYLPPGNLLTPAIPLVAALAVWLKRRRSEAQFTERNHRGVERRHVLTGLLFCALVCALTGCANTKRKVTTHERGWIDGEFLTANPKAVSAESLLAPAMDHEESLRAPKAGILVKQCGCKSTATVLQDGDVILELNQRPMSKLKGFSRAIGRAKPGSSLPAKLYRRGDLLRVQIPVGRETYQREGLLVLGLPTIIHGWDLWPDPGFSLVLLGYEPSAGTAKPRDSDNFVQRWAVWAGVLEFSSGRKILSRETLIAHQ
jgi:hypothetical protein